MLKSHSWTQEVSFGSGQIKYLIKVTFKTNTSYELVREVFFVVPNNVNATRIDTIDGTYSFDESVSTIYFDNSNDSLTVYTHPIFNDLLGLPVNTVEVIKGNWEILNLTPSILQVNGTYPDMGRYAIYMGIGNLKFVPY